MQKEGQKMSKSNDIEVYATITKIMEIENDKEMQHLLNEWIKKIGIDEVFKKIINIYSLNLYD